jgi:hypothetical protein
VIKPTWYNIVNTPVTRMMGLRRIISRNAAIATVNFVIKDCRTGGLVHAIPDSHIVTEANQYSARVSILCGNLPYRVPLIEVGQNGVFAFNGRFDIDSNKLHYPGEYEATVFVDYDGGEKTQARRFIIGNKPREAYWE